MILNKLVEKKLSTEEKTNFEALAEEVRLYHIKSEIVLNASDYGVPQNRLAGVVFLLEKIKICSISCVCIILNKSLNMLYTMAFLETRLKICI